MALPIEYFAERLKNMQLCQMEGKVTNFWGKNFENNCLNEWIVEINGENLGKITTHRGGCIYDIMEDAFSVNENFWENIYKILAEENTGKIIQIRENFYLPNEIEIEKIPFCNVEKFPREKFEKIIEHIEHDNMLWSKECCPTGVVFDDWPMESLASFSRDHEEIIWIFTFVMSILIILGIIKISIEKIFKKKS